MLTLLKNPETTRQQRMRMLAVALVMLALSFAAFGVAVNGPVHWDDTDWLVDNQAVKHSNIGWIWSAHRSTDSYYPLTLTSFWVEYHVWGLWLPGYRIVNILLHAGSAFLLWRILARIRVPGALPAALIWAVHPLQVETVVWITERKNTLSGLFFFAGLLAWMNVIEPAISRRKKSWMFGVTFILLAAALLAKGSTVFFPVAALGLAWLYHRKIRREDVLLSIPLFAAAAVMAGVTMYFERYHASSNFGPEWDLTVLQRLVLVGHCFWFYIGKMLWPTDFAILYPRWPLSTQDPLEYLPIAGAVVLMGGLIWLAWRRKIISPFIAMLIYLAGIFPVIGIFRFYTQLLTYVADHYAYLASAAFLVLMTGLVAAGWQRIRSYDQQLKLPAWLGPMVATVVLAALSIQSFGQSSLYRSILAVWSETLRQTPNAWIAYNAMGEYLSKQGLHQQALEQYEAGLKIKEDSRLLGNAALQLERLNRPNEARPLYEKAVAQHIRHFMPYLRLAMLELNAGNTKRAIELCQMAANNNPYQAVVWFVMGDAYRQDYQLEKAAGAYIQGLQLNPEARGVHLILADVAFELGKYPEAINLYTQAAQRDPNNPQIRFKVAAVLRKMGNERDALRAEAVGRELQARLAAATQQAK